MEERCKKGQNLQKNKKGVKVKVSLKGWEQLERERN